jgi:hypothetical protein
LLKPFPDQVAIKRQQIGDRINSFLDRINQTTGDARLYNGARMRLPPAADDNQAKQGRASLKASGWHKNVAELAYHIQRDANA